jgi:hypothetical protein
MKSMTCPCGETLSGANDQEFIDYVKMHLETSHPDLVGKYTPEAMLSRAQES